MKSKLIAFDDTELCDWLIALIEDGAENFLCGLAEAVLTADAENYSVIRPSLIELKRRYCSGDMEQISGWKLPARRGMSPEIRSVRDQVQ